MAQLHVREGQGPESRAGCPVAGRRRIWRPRLERLETRCLPGFLAPLAYGAGTFPSAVAVGDFNGDGKLDLAVAIDNYPNPGTVSVLLGNGDGTFLPAQSFPAGSSPRSVAVGDFNGDGFPDLAVTNPTNPGTVSILLNDATWTLSLIHI